MAYHSNFAELVCKERVKINITTIKGEQVSYDFVTTHGVTDIKQKRENESKIDKKVIKLSFNGAEIANDKTLGDVKQLAGSNEVSLVAEERMTMVVSNMTVVSSTGQW